MTAKEIRVLIRRLFKEGQLDPLYKAAGRRVSVDEMERRALLDPGFLGQLVVWFSNAGQPLPEFITHPALVRMSRFLLKPGRPDPDLKVALAIALNLPGSEAQRDVLRGVLTCPGATLESTATLLGTDLEVVSLFETLHWNVLDRKQDRAYIARLCGRLGRGAAPGSSGVRGPVLLRIAYELGSPEAVLAKAGVLPLKDPVQNQALLQRLRSARLASAAVGVAMERISDAQNPDLREALRIVAAMNKAKADQIVAPSISIGEAGQLVMKKLLQALEQEEAIAQNMLAQCLSEGQPPAAPPAPEAPGAPQTDPPPIETATPEAQPAPGETATGGPTLGDRALHTDTSGPNIYKLPEFVAKFVPSGAAGEALIVGSWGHILSAMFELIGRGKVTAEGASFQHRCWTATKDADGQIMIEAGMNKSDPNKLGYLLTQKPWNHLEDKVVG